MIKDVASIAAVRVCSLLPVVKLIPIQEVLAVRLFVQMQRETEKLKKRICQNMFDDLEKHREAHRVLEKQLFVKECTVFNRSLSQPFKK